MEEISHQKQNSNKYKKLKDPLAMLLGVTIFLSINNLIYNVLFIVLGSAAELKGYSVQQIGLLGSVYLAGQVVANFSSVLWVRRLNWKHVIGYATAISVISLCLAAFANYLMFLILLAITGLASGAALACVMCCISGMKNPARAYSLGLILQMLIAGAVTYVLQVYITPDFGYSGLLYSIAGVFALTLLFVKTIPSTDTRGQQASAELNTSTKKQAPVSLGAIFALFGIAFYFMSQTGIWGFLERIGDSKNMDGEFIGITLGVVLILCSLGAAIAMKVGNRLGIISPMFIGILLTTLSLFLWYVSDDKWVYSFAALIFASVWNFCLPYQLLAVTQTDTDGRYAAMIPAFQSVGGALGPVMVGVLVFNNNYNYVYLMAFATTVISFIIFWLVVRHHKASAKKVSELAKVKKSELLSTNV
ncbi:Predicted arabinose efflux permease, MFS family [Colwellia chukchiensis]|uniref:Predicted arabinose efflux permease, MFS family n=1 Tax=Colwellia chukchiensis TaxID=641665 RepID=A0A1H7GF63_9GAMM|nr:MFS transporter [Colwellia chukchiensis]SEK34455.1 Predicted arabinose efflux permease, MFS family [Colwellia chukchiensis]